MIKSDMGMVKIVGSKALISAELQVAIEGILKGAINQGISMEIAEKEIDVIVERAKVSVKSSDSDFGSKKDDSEEKNIDNLIDSLTEKVIKELLGGFENGR